jgi:hypothetical protein
MKGRQNRSANDRQLGGVSQEVAKRKWHEDLPVNLKQMAVALEVGYSTVRHYSRMPGFPMLKGLVYPTHFNRWLEKCFSDQSAGAILPEAAEELPAPKMAQPQKSTSLPVKAQKLMRDAGFQM